MILSLSIACAWLDSASLPGAPRRRIVHGVAVSPDDRYAFEGGIDFFKLQ